jgi:hypothetical protein
MSDLLGIHTIGVTRAPVVTDAYNNEQRDWTAATTTTVTGCSVQPVVGAEVTVGRETVVSRWQVFAPEGTDLLATDRVAFAGDLYDVDGEVQRWDFPPLSHVTALLRRSHS